MKTLINSLLGEMRAAILAVLLRPESLGSAQDLKSGAGQYFAPKPARRSATRNSTGGFRHS